MRPGRPRGTPSAGPNGAATPSRKCCSRARSLRSRPPPPKLECAFLPIGPPRRGQPTRSLERGTPAPRRTRAQRWHGRRRRRPRPWGPTRRRPPSWPRRGRPGARATPRSSRRSGGRGEVQRFAWAPGQIVTLLRLTGSAFPSIVDQLSVIALDVIALDVIALDVIALDVITGLLRVGPAELDDSAWVSTCSWKCPVGDLRERVSATSKERPGADARIEIGPYRTRPFGPPAVGFG